MIGIRVGENQSLGRQSRGLDPLEESVRRVLEARIEQRRNVVVDEVRAIAPAVIVRPDGDVVDVQNDLVVHTSGQYRPV